MVWANTNTPTKQMPGVLSRICQGSAARRHRHVARAKSRAVGRNWVTSLSEADLNELAEELSNDQKQNRNLDNFLGAILSSLLIGIDVRPVHAQWTVFDPSQYTLQVAKKIEEAARWVETINHYITMYENAVRQYQKMVESVTNLRGILDKVDEQIMRHKQLITTYATLGRLIRGTFELKKRIEATITSQIHSVVNIARRLKNGIFDMEANKRDLDDFLRHSIGRSADAHMSI